MAETLDHLILKVSSENTDPAAVGIRKLADNVVALSKSVSRATGVIRGFNTEVSKMGASAKVAKEIESVVSKMAGMTTAQQNAITKSKAVTTQNQTEAKSWKDLSAAEQAAVSSIARKAQKQTVTGVPNADGGTLSTNTGRVESEMARIRRETERAAASQKNLVKSAVSGHKRWGAAVNQTRDAYKKQNKTLLDTFGKLGKLTAITWSMVAAARMLGKVLTATVGKQMSYFETLNFATVTFGDNMERATTFAEQMSQGLGFDPAEMLKTQSSVNELAVSMGIGADNSYKMSQGLTQLAYDLASYRDVPIEQVFQNIQSGIAGEARALRRYGVDITMAALQETALAMGIQKRVRNMTQAEKAQLRYVTIMQHTLNAQGDMARTLEQPANMMRVLKDQVGQAARALGALFLPAIQKILPYVILFANSILKALQALATLFGVKLPTFEGAGYEGVGGAFEDAEDSVDGIESGMGGAAKAAKKIKDYVTGIDELNVLAPQQDSGGGGGGGGGGVGGGASMDFDLGGLYDALLGGKPLEEFLQKTKDTLKGLGDTFAPMWEVLKNEVLPAVQDVLSEIGSLFRWVFYEVIQPVWDWFMAEIAPRLMTFFANLLEVAAPLIAAFGDAIINLWRDYIEPAWVALQPFIEGLLDFVNNVLQKLADWATENREILATVFEIIIAFFAAKFAVKSLSDGVTTVKNLGDALSDKAFHTKWTIGQTIANTRDKLGKLATSLDTVLTKTKDLASQGATKLVTFLKNVGTKAKEAAKQMWTLAVNIAKATGNIIKQIAQWIILKVQMVAQKIITGILTAYQWLLNAAMNANPVGLVVLAIVLLIGVVILIVKWIKHLWETNETFRNVVTAVWEAIKNAALAAWDWIKKTWDKLAPWFTAMWEIVKSAAKKVWDWISNVIVGVWDWIKGRWDKASAFYEGLWSTIKTATKKAWDWVSDIMTGAWDKVKKVWDNVGKFFGGVWDGVLKGAETWINNIITALNSLIKLLNVFIRALNKIPGIELGEISEFKKVTLQTASESTKNTTSGAARYAKGGYPTTGSLFIAGEAGAELIGRHEGKTTVMPLENTSFVAAMGSAVYSAVVDASVQSGDGNIVITLDGKKVGEGISKANNRRGFGNNPQVRMV